MKTRSTGLGAASTGGARVRGTGAAQKRAPRREPMRAGERIGIRVQGSRVRVSGVRARDYTDSRASPATPPSRQLHRATVSSNLLDEVHHGSACSLAAIRAGPGDSFRLSAVPPFRPTDPRRSEENTSDLK